MSRTCTYRQHLHACIHTDRRQDGETIRWTNERKENIQTDRVTNNITQKYAYRWTDGHMDGRTHSQYSNR